jgi:histidinol-phosphate aminotransferase
MTTATQAPKLRASVAALEPYVPGEQPKDPGLVKLNTNENPYPPSPRVHAALASLGDRAAGRYPDPMATSLRTSLAKTLGVDPEQVLPTNGSDEILKMAAEAYAERGSKVAYLWPTYSLYPVFVARAEANEHRLPWSPKGPSPEAALDQTPGDTSVLYIANPNPPFGTVLTVDFLRRLAERLPNTLIVSDEAYIAYGGDSAIALVREGMPNILVTRTFSKSHSLAGMRVGFGVASPDVIHGLLRVKDSYNLGAAAQAAAKAAWEDEAHTAQAVAHLIATRARLTSELRRRGFDVPDSAGNFVFAQRHDARDVFLNLRRHKVLARYFDTPELRGGLRITVGTDAEIDALIAALDASAPETRA